MTIAIINIKQNTIGANKPPKSTIAFQKMWQIVSKQTKLFRMCIFPHEKKKKFPSIFDNAHDKRISIYSLLQLQHVFQNKILKWS